MRLELIFADESALLKLAFTDVFERVRAPITRTRPNNTRQSTKSKSSATRTYKSKYVKMVIQQKN